MNTFILSEESIAKIVKEFPLIRRDILKQISDFMDQEFWKTKRLKGMEKEHLTTYGLCATISNNILKFIKDDYPEMQLINGKFKVDHHPVNKDLKKVAPMHYWLQIGDKILDFTANQFNPFCDENFPEVYITYKNNPRYITWNNDDYNEYIDFILTSKDEENVLNWYIKSL